MHAHKFEKQMAWVKGDDDSGKHAFGTDGKPDATRINQVQSQILSVWL